MTRGQEADTAGGRRNTGVRLIDSLLSRIIERPPSERYPGLSYVSIAMRVLSFVLAVLAAAGSVLGIAGLLGGSTIGWLTAVFASFQAGVAALLIYGGSELIHVALDIEKNTRRGGNLHQEEREPPVTSA